MRSDGFGAELVRYIERENQRLRDAALLRSEVAALRSANARLHAQLEELQSRPVIRLVGRVSAALDRHPLVKRVVKDVARRLSR